MKIPKELKIGGHSVKVVIKDNWTGGDDADACWDSGKNEIWIKAELARSQMEATLIHEILHALNAVLDHTVLDSLAEQIYQVFKDNDLLK